MLLNSRGTCWTGTELNHFRRPGVCRPRCSCWLLVEQ